MRNKIEDWLFGNGKLWAFFAVGGAASLGALVLFLALIAPLVLIGVSPLNLALQGAIACAIGTGAVNAVYAAVRVLPKPRKPTRRHNQWQNH